MGRAKRKRVAKMKRRIGRRFSAYVQREVTVLQSFFCSFVQAVIQSNQDQSP